MDKNIRTRTYQERLLSWLIWKLGARLERLSEQAWAAHVEAYYAQNFGDPVVDRKLVGDLTLPCVEKKPATCCQPDCKRGCGC